MNDTTYQVTQKFTELGGEFLASPTELQLKLKNIKAFLFDWDGVFNAGIKTGTDGSTFSETDSMGTNLLRFGHWLEHEQLPTFVILTGENNIAATELAKREHYTAVYYKARNKSLALSHLQKNAGISAEEIAFCFDDVLDLPVAKQCGLRFLVRRSGSPLFEDYTKNQDLCDYATANSGANHAVREICELILGLTGQFDRVIEERCKFEAPYQHYLEHRNSVTPDMYIEQSGQIIPEASANST